MEMLHMGLAGICGTVTAATPRPSDVFNAIVNQLLRTLNLLSIIPFQFYNHITLRDTLPETSECSHNSLKPTSGPAPLPWLAA